MAGSTGFELLMNEEFVDTLHRRIDEAANRIFVQVMTFDGDEAGLGVTERLLAAAQRGVDVRLTIDLFAFRYISDIRSTDPAITDEVAETHAMFDRLEAGGVDVTYVGPWGPLLLFGPVRNHKKIFVVDDRVYLGGINISDHNFAWLDFVVETTDPEIVSETVDDFLATRRGERAARDGAIITNKNVEETFDELIRSAETSIVIASPYALDFDLERRLKSATAPSKTVISPQKSNMAIFERTDPYMRQRLLDLGVDLQTFTEFFHAKFLLVDSKRLLIGSSNFGRHSFRCNQEICVVIEDEELIASLWAALPSMKPIVHRPSRRRYWYGLLVETYLFTCINILERILVPRASVLATR